MKKRFIAILAFVLMLSLMPILGVGALQQLMGNLGGMGGLRTKGAVKASQGYRTDVQVTNGDDAYNTEAEVFGAIAAVGIWATIWEMTIPAQQAVHWGYGSPATPMNQGYMWYAMLQNGTAFTVGVLRLIQQNARRITTIVVAELADSGLHSVTNTNIGSAALISKDEMIALPEKVEHPLVGEDSRIGLQYLIITDSVEDAVGFKIPITVYQ